MFVAARFRQTVLKIGKHAWKSLSWWTVGPTAEWQMNVKFGCRHPFRDSVVQEWTCSELCRGSPRAGSDWRTESDGLAGPRRRINDLPWLTSPEASAVRCVMPSYCCDWVCGWRWHNSVILFWSVRCSNITTITIFIFIFRLSYLQRTIYDDYSDSDHVLLPVYRMCYCFTLCT